MTFKSPFFLPNLKAEKSPRVPFAAVVFGRENGDDLREVLAPPDCLEPLLHALMGPDDRRQFVLGEETLAGGLAEKNGAFSSVVVCEVEGGQLAGVGPDQVADQSAERDLPVEFRRGREVQRGVQVRGDPPVDGEVLSVDQRGQREKVEHAGEGFENVLVVLCRAFVPEAVDVCRPSAFVVASEQENRFWVFDLEGQNKQHDFDTGVPPVHVVSEEQEPRGGGQTHIGKNVDEVP